MCPLYAQTTETPTDTTAQETRRPRREATSRGPGAKIERPAEPTLPTAAGKPVELDTDSTELDSFWILPPEVPVVADSARMTQMTQLADSVEHLTWAQRKARFVPDPIRATWLALVIPGGGQIYNRKYWKLPIVYGGVFGCLYALTWNGQMLRDYQQAYLDIMDSDPNTCSYMKMLPIGYNITGKEDRFKEIFKRKKNIYRKYRDLSIFAFAGVYLISVIDAYVDAELSTFDISHDLTLHFEPSYIEMNCGCMGPQQRTPALQLNLNF